MEASRDWPSILQFGTGDTITEAEVEKHYRQVAKKAHPDAGGSNEAMTQVNLAKGLALAWVEKERKRVAEHKRQEIHPDYQKYAQQQSNNAFSQQYANALNSMGGQGNFTNAAQGQSKRDWVRNLFRSAKGL